MLRRQNQLVIEGRGASRRQPHELWRHRNIWCFCAQRQSIARSRDHQTVRPLTQLHAAQRSAPQKQADGQNAVKTDPDRRSGARNTPKHAKQKKTPARSRRWVI